MGGWCPSSPCGSVAPSLRQLFRRLTLYDWPPSVSAGLLLCVLRPVVVLRGGPSLETNLCSSSRVSVSSFDGAAPSSLGEGKGSPSMLERASVWIISSAGFLPVFDSLPVLLEAALVAILVPCCSGAYPQLAVLHSSSSVCWLLE